MESMNRVLLAGLVGGIVMFIWSSISHTVLPLGEAGIRSLPQEEPVLAAMREAVSEPGFYFFPGMDMSSEPSADEQRAWEERIRQGPAGLIVIDPDGHEPMPPSTLFIELISNIIAATLAAFILAKLTAAPGSRVVDAAVFGLVGWFSLSVSYWNWWKFPSAMILAEGVDQLVGWTLAGFAMAMLLKPKAAAARPA
jgi:hypothetical protein